MDIYIQKNYCVYITHYFGNLLPQNYIGSTSIKRINKGYRGSVTSQKYKNIWKKELTKNPQLFETQIISTHYTMQESLQKELKLQKIFNVVKNPLFINESYASPNGYFGRSLVGLITPLHKRSDGTSVASDNVKNGTHNFLKRTDGTSMGKEQNEKRIKNGTHHFLKQKDGHSIGGSIQLKRVKNGIHHFLRRNDGTSVATDMIENGTNMLISYGLGKVSCFDKHGNHVQISKKQYKEQQGPKENWEWVHNRSLEGIKRRSQFNKNRG